MAERDIEFWNRRSKTATIVDNLRWTFAHVWTYGRGPALGIVAVQILLGIQPALLIYVTHHLIDTVVQAAGGGADGFGQILPWILAYGLTLLLTNELLWKARDVYHTRLQQSLGYALNRRFLTKAAQLPLVFFESSSSYDQLERARDSGSKLDRFFFAAMQGFQGTIKALTVAAMFAPVAWWIPLALLAALLPQIRLEIQQSRMFMGFNYGQTEALRRASYVDRLLTGRNEQKEMRLFALHPTLSQRWADMRQNLRQQLWQQKQQQALVAIPVNGLRISVSVGIAVTLAYFLDSRLLTPGRFVALFRGVDNMLQAGGTLGYNARELQNLSAEIDYVREFLDLPEDDSAWMQTALSSTKRDKPFPTPLRHGFAIDNLRFSYPATDSATESHQVLRGVNFHLRPGERVALVGANGAGKSTLAKILLGLYAPTSGQVLADGVNYAEIDRNSLTYAVSAAFQDFFNFELTAEQSIGIGALGSAQGSQDAPLWPAHIPPDPAIVENAARRAGADEVAAGLPQGYNSPVGHILDGGQGLSGGQWQRLAVARAYTRDPQLLILDEPTAALDPMAEAELYKQFSDLLEGHTALLISHRLGSARMADRILVLDNGRIVETGHHDELLAIGGVYAAMWEEQAAWYR